MFLVFLLVSCSIGALITPNAATTTFSFTQSTASFRVWTTPATRRIRTTSVTPPAATANTLNVFCAREELESFQVRKERVFDFFFHFFLFQVIVAPTTIPSMTVSWGTFSPPLVGGGWLEVSRATFSPTRYFFFVVAFSVC
jgi:uncharacterized membrane protein